MNDTSKLVKKLVEVLGDLGVIKKKGRNVHFNYEYISEGQMMAELRKRLSSRGLFLFTSVESIAPHYGEAKSGVFVSVTTKHTFVDSESGERFEVGGAGLGWDSGDKGVYKAITGATKYALMKNFLVTDEQDPEAGNQKKETKEEKPGATGHRRTREYDQEPTQGNQQATKDLLELKAFLTEHKIPDAFLLRLLVDKKLVDPHVKSVAGIKPGILRRVLAPKSVEALEKAWKLQQQDEDSGSQTAPADKDKREVRTREGDQTQGRKPVVEDTNLVQVLGAAGFENWREVPIHFGDKKNTLLGKLTQKSLAWWIGNYAPKPYRGTWQDKDLLLDAALCLASAEMGGAE